MNKKIVLWTILIVTTLILNACVPQTFSTPTEIHITNGDRVKDAAIAVDAVGRSHIAGVVADRIVYYRTRFGQPLVRFTMVMSGSGTNWKQYDPDIAVKDNGTAYIVWVEQHGGPEKFACYQEIPLIPPVGGYDKGCDPLDGTQQTAGNVWVTASGDTAYAVYDRPYTDGRTTDLWYRRIAGGSGTGRVAWFSESFETARFYSLDLGIDAGGFLHVGYHYNWTVTGDPPFAERLEIRSNRSVQADGQMTQVWVVFSGNAIDQDVPVSLSFYKVASTERVALAHVNEPTVLNKIYIESCVANGCSVPTRDTYAVILPSTWDAISLIDDVEIEGIDDDLYLSFIGDDNTAPTGAPQVYYKDAFSNNPPTELSDGSATFKLDLEMTHVVPRKAVGFIGLPIMAWGETNLVTNSYFVTDGIFPQLKVSDDNCTTSLLSGEIASNGIYLSGVWDACANTWFTTQAWNSQLPLIIK